MDETDGSRLLLAGSDGIFGNDGGGGVANAQLVIDVYPSQDNNNQTIWIFSGSSTAISGSSIRSSQNYHVRDSWKTRSTAHHPDENYLYSANKPTNQIFNLSPLISSSNTKDIGAVTRRLQGSHGFGPFSTNSIFFSDNAINTPTITIGSASRTIGSLFMNDNTVDEIGIRNTPPNLVFTNGQNSRWFGSGILDKPIGDFRPLLYFRNTSGPYFATDIHMAVHSRVIPEPGNYMLIACMLCVVYVVARSAIAKRK